MSKLKEELNRSFEMTDCDASASLEQCADKDDRADITHYRQIVGSLMFLMIGTRPDIAAAVSIVSQFAANPTPTHVQAAKRILRYLKGTIGHKLHLGGSENGDIGNNTLVGYCDANWGNDINTRKSTSGYIFYLGGGVVSWSSKRQATVALSSTEAEYMHSRNRYRAQNLRNWSQTWVCTVRQIRTSQSNESWQCVGDTCEVTQFFFPFHMMR